MVYLHFIKDYELVRNSVDINTTFEVLKERRKLVGNNGLIMDLHLELDRMFREEDETIMNLAVLSSKAISSKFRNDTLLEKLKMLRRSKSYEKCVEEINNLFLEKEWRALYEQAKIQMELNKKNDARESLKKLMSLIRGDKEVCKKAVVLNARLVNTKEGYENAVKVVSGCEKLFFYQGKFLERVHPSKSLASFSKSLENGTKYINETIPRMFHIFCEEEENCMKKAKSVFLKESLKIMGDLVEFLPSYNFLPFFNQIIAKISHSTPEVISVISKLLFKLFNSHPHQTFWNALIMINSTRAETRKRMKEIVESISFDNRTILRDVIEFSKKLVKLGEYKAKDRSELSVSKDFDGLDFNFPLDIVIPNGKYKTKIHGMADTVVVLLSLQSPKKISLIGDNGKMYNLLCKPKDDLRRDNRFMDLNRLINYVMRTDSECSSRNMNVRMYNVVPIDHSNGVIEWIDGLNGLRSICSEYYRKEGINISTTVQKYRIKKKIDPSIFEDVLKMYPPKLHFWFKDKFNDPYEWYKARERYIRTYAVMNAVGWFMGLGDRHCDNIMFDSKTGDTVHVDLNCIFDKGKTFEIPERVPFRLTQNIVDAFGVLKTEGSYRRILELSIDVLSQNRDLMVANLLSFVYDPLLDWTFKKKSGNHKQIIDDLHSKLLIDDPSQKSEELITEASSSFNLANMYIGWCSFI
jgi:serine/threonine-protein kinase ATR